MNISINSIIFTFVCCPIACFVSVLTTFTIYILNKLQKESEIFVYFRLENIFILIDCIIAALLPIYKCKNCFSSIDPSIQCIIDLVFYYVIATAFEMSSLICAILAALNCLLKFNTNPTKAPIYSIIFKINPNLVALVSFALSMLNFTYFFFSIEIGTYSNGNNTYEFDCIFNDFSHTLAYNIITIVSFGISNGVLIFILMGINAIILFKLKRSLEKNKTIKLKQANIKRKNVERKFIKLILSDCFYLVIGRTPFLIYFILTCFYSNFYSNFRYLGSVFSLLLYLTYLFKFVSFYWLNNQFKSQTNQALLNIKNKFM